MSVKRAAAAGCSVSSLSWHQLRGMRLPLSRRRLFVSDPLDATGFDGRLLACPPCCHAAPGLWAWMRLCPHTVQLPLITASPHCLGVVFVRWCSPYLDVSHSTLLQSTFVCLWVVAAASPCFRHRAVMRLMVCGRGCDCVGPAYSPSTCHCDCRSMRKRRMRMSERRWRRRRRILGHPYFRRRCRLLPLSLPAFLTGSSHDCVSQLCCRGQQSTRHLWNRRQGLRGRGRLRRR